MKKARKIDRKFNSIAIITTFFVAAAGWMMAQAQDPPPGGINQPPPQVQTTPAPGQPMKLNKCSQLIGTTVENSQGEKLGKIDEVVVDFETGRVSYCVLSAEHKLFATPKYLAVPLAALQPSEDGSRLILNADKDKLAQAQGFDRDNWPSVTNPAWGAQPIWQTTPKATIAAPSDPIKDKPAGTNQ
jgi:sporulation protein YlmC with PRC-barrel domain